MVDPRYVVVVRSFNRPAQLARLLGQLEGQASFPVEIFVFDDASTVSMEEVSGHCRRMGWHWVRMPRNLGKPGAWKMFNMIFGELRRRDGWTHALFLDDDMGLCGDFFELMGERWRSLPSEKAATLTMMVDSGRGRGPCWTNVKPQRVSELAWKTQWVDGSFLCSRAALDSIGWTLEPIPGRRWARASSLSTGVGKQLSGRLVAAGMALYQVERSLVVHAFGPSHMNPEERRREPLESVDFVDGPSAAIRLAASGSIVASLATIPSRVRQLEQVVEALLPQVEMVFVYLNGHEQVPSFLQRPGIIVERSQAHGDRGDAGKFFWSEELYAYHLICDDDLDYPSDYACRMVSAIERYARRAVVGLHGVVLSDRLDSYFNSRRVLHFARRLDEDRPVHLLGTGTVGYHHATLRVRPDDFEQRNMADVWFGLLCQQQQVPCVAISRRDQWLSGIKTGGPSIYNRTKLNPRPVTEALGRTWPWKIWELEEEQSSDR